MSCSVLENSWLEMYYMISLVPLAFLEYYGLGKGHYSYMISLEKAWLDISHLNSVTELKTC